MNEQNIAHLIEEQLSEETREILNTAGLLAAKSGSGLYLVGGVVRDLLLHRENHDLDLVIEGDAIELANLMAEAVGGRFITHPRFRTATVKWGSRSVDFVTARFETYERPGALPQIQPGKIEGDLSRRDFTINSMAVCLSPDNYGKLIDPYKGCEDLKNKRIRILYANSFINDATRMWRAVRYEQRLGFALDMDTLDLLKDNIDTLKTISRDRIRHELELVLKEEYPERALRRADELGMLDDLLPGLQADDLLAEWFAATREYCAPNLPSPERYLALLVYRMPENEIRKFITDLKLRKQQASVLSDICTLKEKAEIIDDDPLQPSAIYQNLHGISPKALTAGMQAEQSPAVRKNISLYLDKLRLVKLSITGSDLKQMGITSGPKVKILLEAVLHARLDGEVSDKESELERVKELAGLD